MGSNFFAIWLVTIFYFCAHAPSGGRRRRDHGRASVCTRKSLIIAREEKTMKETYESPVIEIIEIDADDIIFASGICTEANR